MVEDITPDPDERGLIVEIRVSKTGAGTVVVPWQHGSPVCPVTAWHRWREAAAITEGPAFRALTPHRGRLTAHGISEKTVRRIITAAEARAGLSEGYAGHSGRRSFVTQAVEVGASLNEICAVTRHVPGSRTVHEYFEVRDRWAQHPLNRIMG
ncbi:hypothetical protein [Nocardia sp. NPDC047648]|uniref:hypothetical protein n=1 Tax=Nocardia sp. NPDC047648 TaxID=3155625 RepID=UPI0033D17472